MVTGGKPRPRRKLCPSATQLTQNSYWWDWDWIRASAVRRGRLITWHTTRRRMSEIFFVQNELYASKDCGGSRTYKKNFYSKVLSWHERVFQFLKNEFHLHTDNNRVTCSGCEHFGPIRSERAKTYRLYIEGCVEVVFVKGCVMIRTQASCGCRGNLKFLLHF